MKNRQYDVAVCGGGIAGVAAAIASARRGMKTLLIEKQCLLGGLATSGLIYIYLPLCDGCGRQVTFGLAEELLRRCTDYGPFELPVRWGGNADGISGADEERFQCCFSPAGYVLTLDRMLSEAGVELWLDTALFDVHTEKNCVKSITVFNTSGLTEISAGCFVDATGGAYLTGMAGGELFYGENYVTPWVLEMAEDSRNYHFTDSLHVKAIGFPVGRSTVPPVRGGREITDFIRNSWEVIRRRYDGLSAPEKKRNYPVHLPAMPQLRKIARINARTLLANGDAGKHFADSIGTVGDWRRAAPVWETPYGTLVPKDVGNVLAAGRCIGTDGDAWEVFRVIPAAAMTGEAAGTAASLCVEKGIMPENVKISDLQNALTKPSVR